MQIVDNIHTRELNEIYRDITDLGLEANVLELELYGYTVIENAAPLETIERAREVILDVVEEKMGRRPSLDDEQGLGGFGEYDPNRQGDWREHQEWELVPYLLFRDPVFEDLLLNPRPLTLITYLLGQSCLLSSMTSHFKGPGEHTMLGLHSDTGNGAPLPFAPYSIVANLNYVMTDYSREGGCLGVVPGSHRLARQPIGDEQILGGHRTNPDAIPIEVPAGSAVVWHGNLWHGSYPRQTPGIRMNLATYFCRKHLQTQERFREHVPAEVMERRGDHPRFRSLMGLNTNYGWGEEGPDGGHPSPNNWFA